MDTSPHVDWLRYYNRHSCQRLPDFWPLEAGGDAREAVKALLVANEFLEREIEEKVSRGYMRGGKHGRFKTYSGER
jgi:hypothetical protein